MARTMSVLVALLVALVGCASGPRPIQGSAEDPKSLAAAVSILREGLVRPFDETLLASRSIAELVQRADPDFGEYFTKQDLEDLRREGGSQVNAFGLSFRRQKGETIVGPLGRGPASLAGLVRGDKLESIEGQDVQRMGLSELYRLLSSDQQQRVTLTVRRGDSLESFVVNAAARFVPRRVEVEWPTPEIMLLRLPQLDETTLKESADTLATHWRSHGIKGVILDLRGHPGGLMTSVIGHAAIFLRSNSLVATLRSNSSVANNMRFQAAPKDYVRRNASDPLINLPAAVKTIPLAVLIDESTFSGAELIAAAIQSHKRGTLVGQQSGGIASLQSFSLLPNGDAIKYTSAYWEPPSGNQVDGVGVLPDRIIKTADPKAAVIAAIGILASTSTSQPTD